MAIENTHEALAECADHLEFVGQQCAGPMREELEKGVGHLATAQTAIQLAWEELMLADGIFHRLQNPSMEVSSRVKRAAQIAGQVADGSSNELIAGRLPKNTRDMVGFLESLTKAVFATANNAMVFANRLDPIKDDLKNRTEGWGLQALESNGGLMLRHSEEVRGYLDDL